MNRQQGVVVPEGQRRELERAEPNKLLDIIPGEMFAVRYADGTGKVIREFWYKVGNTFYQPPGAEQFAGQLREVKETFVKQANTKLAQMDLDPNDVPQSDAVDVVAQQTAKEVATPPGNVDV